MKFLFLVSISFLFSLNSFAKTRLENFEHKYFVFEDSQRKLNEVVKKSNTLREEIERIKLEINTIDKILRQDRSLMQKLEERIHKKNFELRQLRNSLNDLKNDIAKLDGNFRNFQRQTRERIEYLRKEAVFYKGQLMELLRMASVEEKNYERYRKAAISWEDEYRRRSSAVSYCRRIPNAYCQGEVGQMNWANSEMARHRNLRDRAKRLADQYDRKYEQYRSNSRRAERQEKNEVPVLRSQLEEERTHYQAMRRELPPRLRTLQKSYNQKRSVVFNSAFSSLIIHESNKRNRQLNSLFTQYVGKFGNYGNIEKLKSWISNSKGHLTSLFKEAKEWEELAANVFCSNDQAFGQLICPDVNKMLAVSKYMKSEIAELQTYKMYDYCKSFPQHRYVLGYGYNPMKISDVCIPVTFRFIRSEGFFVDKDFDLEDEAFLSLFDNKPNLRSLGFSAYAPKESLELLERYHGKIQAFTLKNTGHKTNPLVGENCENIAEMDYITDFTLQADDPDTISCIKRFPQLKKLVVGTGSRQNINLKKVHFPPQLTELLIFANIKKNTKWIKRVPKTLTHFRLSNVITTGLFGKRRKKKLQKLCLERNLTGMKCYISGI